MQDARARVVVGAVVVLLAWSVGCFNRREQSISEPQMPAPAQLTPEQLTRGQGPLDPAAQHGPFHTTLLGRSVQGRDIVMHTLGGVSHSVLVIGGIHGSEPTSVDVANGLLDVLARDAKLARGKSIAIMPNVNPDGYEKRSRYNANHIDVNRNFAATNFFSGRDRAGGRATTRLARGGEQPNSEPETLAIVRAIEVTRPNLLISIHSIDKGRECNNFDGPAERFAQIMSKYNGYPSVGTIGYATPGSLGSYAGLDRQIPMITLELPRNVPGDAAWEQNRDALLAAIAAVP